MPWNQGARRRISVRRFAVVLAGFFQALCLSIWPAIAQKPKVETYAVGDGLPSLAISDLATHPSGRLWILTQAGVSIYDGQAFTAPPSASDLPAEELGALEIDAAGEVWTVTRWTGPHVYRLDGGRWRPLPAPASAERALGVTSLAVQPASGVVAAGSVHFGLWLWDGAAWTHLDVAGGLPSANVRTLAAFDDAIAVGTGAGLCLVVGVGLDCRPRDRENRLAEPILGLSARGQRLWILAGSWLGYLEDGAVHVAIEDLLPPGLQPQTRGTVLVDAVGGVYFGVEQQLLFLAPEQRRFEVIGLRQGLATDGVTSLLLDRESNVWVGSLRGLSKIESRRFLTFDRDAGLLEDEVTAVIEPVPGKLILGHNTGLSFLERGEIDTLLFPRTPDTAIDAFRVMDMAQDRHGAVWVAAHRMGLLRLAEDHSFETWLSGSAVISVELDSEGRLWVCSVDQLFAGDGRSFTPVDHGQGDQLLRWLTAGPDGRLYVSTAQGLLWSDGQSWRLARGPTTEANILYGVLPAASGEVWVGARGGLYRLQNEELIEVSDGELRIDQSVYLILEDRQGRTWFGTGDGVRLWDGRTLRHLSVRHGLAGWEANRGAGWVDQLDRVWIGTDRGVSMYQEPYDARRTVAPRVEIRAIEAGGIPLSLKRRIDLSHNQNNLVFHADTVSFSSEEAVVYRYRLEGFEEAWQGPGAPPPAGIRYTNVPPGSYRFRVTAGWQGGVWSEEAVSVPIFIARPFWRQVWFFFAATAAVMAVGFGFHGYRTRRIRAHNLELAKLNSRLRGALAERQALIDDLETKNAELERFTYTVSHDLKSPLVTIRGFLGYLVRDATAGDMDKVHRDAERIKAAAATMGRLLDELLELSRIGRMVNPPETVAFGELAEQAVELASARITERGVAVEIAPDLPPVHGDRVRLLEVLQNLVENAVKFMGEQAAPKIEIGVREGTGSDSGSIFYVRDNGIGIEGRYQKKVFGLFERLDQTIDGTGVGLAIVHRIIEFHGGRVWVESEGIGKGATFCFTLSSEAEG